MKQQARLPALVTPPISLTMAQSPMFKTAHRDRSFKLHQHRGASLKAHQCHYREGHLVPVRTLVWNLS